MKKFLIVLGLLSTLAHAQDFQDVPDTQDDEVTALEELDEGDDQVMTNDEIESDEDMTFRKYVGVPKGYVYKPSLGTTHDYCSYSPDSYLKADFRGPCARHDMCYDSPTDKKKCDVALLKNMKANCEHAYGKLNPLRYSCITVAGEYFAAVVVHH